jgi:hypothetical protein
MGYCGRGSKSASSLARHSPSTMPVDQVGPETPLEGDHRLLRVGHVIAEPLEREQEAGVGPEGSIRSRVGLGSASRAWPALQGTARPGPPCAPGRRRDGRRHCRG